MAPTQGWVRGRGVTAAPVGRLVKYRVELAGKRLPVVWGRWLGFRGEPWLSCAVAGLGMVGQ